MESGVVSAKVAKSPIIFFVSSPSLHCPRCGASIDREVSSCPACGLSVKELDRRFGPIPRHFGSVTDLAGVMTAGQNRRLAREIQRLETKFPQVRIVVLVGSLPHREARLYGFWLLNRGRFAEAAHVAEKNFTVLLFVNIATSETSVTVGYGMENVLSEADLSEALEEAAPLFASQRFAEGAERFLLTFEKLLKGASRVREKKRVSPPDGSVEAQSPSQEAY